MGSQNLVLKVKTINSPKKKKKNQLDIDQIAVNRKGYEVINQKKSKTNRIHKNIKWVLIK